MRLIVDEVDISVADRGDLRPCILPRFGSPPRKRFSEPLETFDRQRRQQMPHAGKMVDWRTVRHSRARGDRAQLQGFQPLFGEDCATDFEQSRLQDSVVVAIARLHRDSLTANRSEAIMTMTDSGLTGFSLSRISSTTRCEDG